ncbi:MAG: hypothetical protein V2J65_32110 [Desulfobacteraceae bacterium]|jgi:hypothetical protein|nr:hypothetical protein [Desulfobacteraceae bacterium]
MTQKKHAALSQSLTQVKEQFKTWRQTRKSPRPIPAELWAAAAGLTAKHSISQIAKELALDYTSLKNRVAVKKKTNAAKMSPADFIEVNLEPPAAAAECIVEMQDIRGAKMRMHFRGKTDFDLLQLAKAFWSKKP